MRVLTIAVACCILGSTPVLAASPPLTANSGAVTFTGSGKTSDGETFTFAVTATLKTGDFAGFGKVEIGGTSFEAPLMKGRSYFNPASGRCVVHWEQDRSRAELSGFCDSLTFSENQQGFFNAFIPPKGSLTGKFDGKTLVAGGAAAVKASPTVVLPKVKLTCAYQDVRIAPTGEGANQYSLAMSNIPGLTLSPSGTYTTASGSGKFAQQGDKIRLTSGRFSGAVGTLEPDRSGRPSVVFHIEDNRRPDGVHVVDPYTTRCTQGR